MHKEEVQNGLSGKAVLTTSAATDFSSQHVTVTSVRMERRIFFILVGLIYLAALGAIEPWWEAFFESAILVLAACAIIADRDREPWHMPAVVVPLIGLMTFGCFQMLPLWRSYSDRSAYEVVTSNPFETKSFIIKLLVVAVLLTMVSRYTANRERLLILMKTVTIAGAVSALCALLRLVPTAPLGELFQNKLQGESFAQFTNKNHFALLMEMSIGPTLALVYLATTRTTRVLCGAALILIATALLSANSRGGFLSFLGQATLVSWIIVNAGAARFFLTRATTSQVWWRRLLSRSRTIILHSALLLLLFATLFVGFVWLGGERIRQRLQTVPAELMSHADETQNTAPRRLEIWSATWNLIKAHPFAGSGLGAYETAIGGHFENQYEWRPQQAHNEYLELIAGAGAAGAILGLWFVAVICRELKRRLLEDAFGRVVCVGAAIGLAGVAIHSLVDFGLHVMANTVVCTVLIALATVKSPQRNTEKHREERPGDF